MLARSLVALLILLGIGGPSAPPQTGSLKGSLSETPAAVVDLTKEGTRDWAHWGPNDRKASGANSLPMTPASNSGPLVRVDGGPTHFRWSDGKTTRVSSGIASGIRSPVGFALSAPADKTLRTLRLYVGVDYCEGALTAHLSDGSAPDYTEIALTEMDGSASGVFVFTYRAAKPHQTLILDWKNTAAYGPGGFVVLRAATLQ